ncbi:block of proliferation 1, partial [Chelydra serpentina]
PSIPSTQVLEERAQESDDLTDSEESLYSGLEDSGSDSSTEEEEAAEDQDSGDEGKRKGSLLSKKAQAGMASQKKEEGQSLETESMPSAQQGLPLKGEYEEDSSDEEVGPRLKWHTLCCGWDMGGWLSGARLGISSGPLQSAVEGWGDGPCLLCIS